MKMGLAFVMTLMVVGCTQKQEPAPAPQPPPPAPTVSPDQKAQEARALAEAQARAEAQAIAQAEAREPTNCTFPEADRSPDGHLAAAKKLLANPDLDWAHIELSRFEDICDAKPTCCSDTQKEQWRALRIEVGKLHFAAADKFFKAGKWDDALSQSFQGDAFGTQDPKARAEIEKAYAKNIGPLGGPRKE